MNQLHSLGLIIQPAQPTKPHFNEFDVPLAKEHFSLLTMLTLIWLWLVINSFEIDICGHPENVFITAHLFMRPEQCIMLY